MIFHWCLKEMSLQISWTLRILADPSNAVVWKVSAHPPIFNHLNTLTKPLATAPNTPILVTVTTAFTFHNFVILWLGPCTCLFFRYIWFSLCGPLGRQSQLNGSIIIATCQWAEGIECSPISQESGVQSQVE